MMQTTAVVIGAGHAGLAMSRRLTERSIDHVVLERGAVANSWRSQRWPSLRLLTPNWLTRLPGYDYAGDDPDGYMPAAGVVSTLTRYARLAAAPVRTEIHRSGRPVTPGRRRTRPAAPPLPRPRHLLVAGSHRSAGRTLRPDR
jgi:cation diffusion facilitator CzcD-associated flavoprotein CzcO